tara:strand:+ start:2481 stop:3284 length:804 start_codon:yes stop_codon:yes gene_type:complete
MNFDLTVYYVKTESLKQIIENMPEQTYNPYYMTTAEIFEHDLGKKEAIDTTEFIFDDHYEPYPPDFNRIMRAFNHELGIINKIDGTEEEIKKQVELMVLDLLGRYMYHLSKPDSTCKFLVDIMKALFVKIISGESKNVIKKYEIKTSDDVTWDSLVGEYILLPKGKLGDQVRKGAKSKMTSETLALALWFLYKKGFVKEMPLGKFKNICSELTGHSGIGNFILEKSNELDEMFKRKASGKSISPENARKYIKSSKEFISELEKIIAN